MTATTSDTSIANLTGRLPKVKAEPVKYVSVTFRAIWNRNDEEEAREYDFAEKLRAFALKISKKAHSRVSDLISEFSVDFWAIDESAICVEWIDIGKLMSLRVNTRAYEIYFGNE